MSKQDRLKRHIDDIIAKGILSDVKVCYNGTRDGLTHLNVGLYWDCDETREAMLVGVDKARAMVMLTDTQMEDYILTVDKQAKQNKLDEAISIFENRNDVLEDASKNGANLKRHINDIITHGTVEFHGEEYPHLHRGVRYNGVVLYWNLNANHKADIYNENEKVQMRMGGLYRRRYKLKIRKAFKERELNKLQNEFRRAVKISKNIDS